MPEFPAGLLPSLLKADTTSRASNTDILSFFSKTPLLIDRLRYIRDSYKVVFTELLLEDDTRVGFYKESNGLLVWQGSYLTRSAESHLSWHSVTAAISALVDNHELIAAIDPKKAVSQDEQLSFDLPENASRGDEVGALEVDDIYSEEEQDEKIKAALPTYHYKEPQPDDGGHITEDDVNAIITRGSVFEGGKYRIYNHFQQKKAEKETVAFLKKEYGIGGFSWTFADGGSGFVSFDGKGFSILYDFKDDLRYEKKLKWKEVGKRLEYLVRMDRYLTDAEREKMPAWINRQTESKPLPPPIPDQKPVCKVGSTVYLENDQRFTVESIGQFDVHLRNEDFPLVGRAVSREQFQQLLDANPRNGGMVLSEQQRESLVQEQREQALSYIEDYLKDEFEITEPDFSNLTQIGLGYTTTEDEQHTIQVNADLEHCTISKFVDNTLYAQEKFSSLEEMNRKFLSILDFDSLMEVDINEIEEQEPEISADEPEESTFVSQVMQDVDRLAAREEPAEYDRTNYLAPYEPAIPEGAKAKFAANVQAIRTLKKIEQRMASGGAPASEQEQDILAGYLGWGGLADAFDPDKDNWAKEYTVKEVRPRYSCFYKIRHPGDCDGQSGYGVSKLDSIVEEVVRQIFAQFREVSRKKLLESVKTNDAARIQKKVKKIQKDLENKQKELDDLKAETILVIRGVSALDKELLGTLVAEAREALETLEKQLVQAQEEYEEATKTAKRSNYICNELFTWADVYDTANHDERRAILQQFIKEIRVRKDYEISITLNASFNQVEQLKAVSTYDGAEIFEGISEKGA